VNRFRKSPTEKCPVLGGLLSGQSKWLSDGKQIFATGERIQIVDAANLAVSA
tara:strand:- start:12072 stop:12227 length:156 start_codon:yes stop_codon:yes gene_type:complete